MNQEKFYAETPSFILSVGLIFLLPVFWTIGFVKFLGE